MTKAEHVDRASPSCTIFTREEDGDSPLWLESAQMRPSRPQHPIASLLLFLSACSVGTDDVETLGSDAMPTETCGCEQSAHSDRIYVLSQDAELYTFDPTSNEFEFQERINCPGGTRAFSMAVDATGHAWILFAESERLYKVDLDDPSSCT